jgi:alpha-glucosidase (family GH31 glycosyl hydrolase)
LIAPVVEKGAASRTLYLPRGVWTDFWTGEKQEGGREIERRVDLETTPIYIRAGAVLPMGPVKQYVEERVDGPMTINVYPGADGSFFLYEDDGRSFNYRRGEWSGVEMKWNDSRRTLALRGAGRAERRELMVKLGNETRSAVFGGRSLEVRF